MVQRPFEDFRSVVGDQVALHTKPIDSGIERESKKIRFGDETEVKVDAIKTYESELIDIKKYRRIDFFVRNRVHAQGHPVELFITTGVEYSGNLTTYFYDWNNERWDASFPGYSAIPIAEQPAGLQVLSTHPNAYWIRDLMADNIKVRFRPSDNTDLTKENYFEVWLVGELNV